VIRHRWSKYGSRSTCARCGAVRDATRQPILYTTRVVLEDGSAGWTPLISDRPDCVEPPTAPTTETHSQRTVKVGGGVLVFYLVGSPLHLQPADRRLVEGIIGLIEAFENPG
jgi:hypothetical protein